jgi:hypothetical protein
MAKKKRLKGDPFGWVEGTTQSSGPSAADEQTPPPKSRKRRGTATSEAAASSQAAVSRETERTIYVKYKKDTGEIIAIQELMNRPKEIKTLPWLEIPEDMDARPFDLTGELLDKPIIDIHNNYRVSKSGASVRLVPKR